MKQLLLLLSIPTLFLFTLTAQAQECNCGDAFEQTVQNYEKNYSLFQIKVTDKNQDIYKAHTEVYRGKAAEVQQIEDCLPVLQQWLTFFRDGHSRIEYAGASGMENHSERIEIDRLKYQADYKKKKYKKNDLLGIWKYGGYEVAIMPTPQRTDNKGYIGVLLSSTNKRWKPGDVKFKLTHVYGNDYEALHFMDDYSAKKLKTKLTNAYTLELVNFNNWTKVWPHAAPDERATDETNLYSEFHFRMIDGEIPYIRFPNFYEREPAFVDSLLKANHEALINADFIIVDVRDNGGGYDAVYRPALPYILSGPIKTPNYGIWMSEENIATMLDGKEPADFDEEQMAEYKYMMSFKDSVFWEGNGNYAVTYTPKALFAPHQKVAVLINGDTGSSGETFVYRVKQSDKAVLYGQNTAGVVDGFHQFTKRIGCFDLKYPSSFRARDVAEHPIDPYGFAPDVYLSEEVDALEFSIQHMRQLVKALKD